MRDPFRCRPRRAPGRDQPGAGPVGRRHGEQAAPQPGVEAGRDLWERGSPGLSGSRGTSVLAVAFIPMPPPTDDLERSRARALSRRARWGLEHPVLGALVYGVLAGVIWGVIWGVPGTYGPGKAALSGLIFGALSGLISWVGARRRVRHWRELASSPTR
jgi:hypothetical protein